MSAFVTVNGDIAVEAVISIPRVGSWHADINLAGGSNAATGPVTISIADGFMTMVGFCFRFGVFSDYVRMRIVGGNGTLRTTALGPKAYQGVPLKVALQDVLSQAGETLSPASDQGLLAGNLPFWATIATGVRGAGGSLTSLLKAGPPGSQGQSPVWRMASTATPSGIAFDGSVWAGYETWPIAPILDFQDYVYELDDATVGKIQIAPNLPLLLPGTVFRRTGTPDRQITYVRHQVEATKHLRTMAYYET